MTQQINLLNPNLIRPRDWLSLRNIALIYLVVVLIMLWLQHLANQTLQGLQQQRNQAVTAYETTQKTLQAVAKAQHQEVDTAAQEKELQTLLKKRQTQHRILSAFKQVQTDDGHHVLDVMQGLSHFSHPQVWITGFVLDAFSRSLSLSGRALNADQVPLYLEQLSHAPVFQGQLFSGLTIKALVQTDERPLLADGSVTTITAGSPSAVATPAPAERTQSVSTAPSTAKTAAVAPLPPLAIVEFEVKGLSQPIASLPEPGSTPSAVSPPPSTAVPPSAVSATAVSAGGQTTGQPAGQLAAQVPASTAPPNPVSAKSPPPEPALTYVPEAQTTPREVKHD